MKEEPYENKILKSLFQSPKTFNELLKDIIISNRVLADKLKALQKKKYIAKQGSRKSKYEINPLYLDCSPLYPDIVAAVLFKSLEHGYNAQWEHGAKLINQYAEAGDKENCKKIQTELAKSMENSFEILSASIGYFILYLITIQSEKDINAQKIIDKFTRFLYPFIKRSVRVKQGIRKMNNDIEKMLTAPYPEQEKILRLLIKSDLNEAYADQYIIQKEIPTEIKEILADLCNQRDEFYAELGFPFNILYNELKNSNIPITSIKLDCAPSSGQGVKKHS